MAETRTLHDAFVEELRDLYHAEKQLTRALPRLAKASTTPELTRAFEAHLTETEEHVGRLEQVFAELGETPRAKTCDGMKGIIDEASTLLGESFEPQTRDAVIIAAAQRAEHYEIAAYGTLAAWARAMAHDSVADLLERNLGEESAANEKLTEIAEGGINRSAAELAHHDLRNGGGRDRGSWLGM